MATHLVDGHNAIRRLGLRRGRHADQRRELLLRVREIDPDAEVFFDARSAPPGLPDAVREEGVKVRYCRRREADRAILDRVRDAPRPRDLVVVSDDREVVEGARQLGAGGLSVTEFSALLDPPPPEAGEKPEGETLGFSPEDFGLPKWVNLKHPPSDLEGE